MEPIRVLVAGDSRMAAEVLAEYLSAVPDLWVVATVWGGDSELSRVVGALRPDVVVVEMPAVESLEVVVGCVRQACASSEVVVVTSRARTDSAAAVAFAGANGWVSQESTADVVVDVVRRVCRGEAAYPPEQLGLVLRGLRRDAERARSVGNVLRVLTPRERDVLGRLVRGQRDIEIAAELGLSPHTVRTHTNNIFGKLGVSTRLEAVHIAMSAGLR